MHYHIGNWLRNTISSILNLEQKLQVPVFLFIKEKELKFTTCINQLFLDKNIDAGYKEYQVPHLINEASGIGTGQLPDKEGQMYHSTVDDLYLIPTGEVPITNMFRGNLVSEDDFPIHMYRLYSLF